MNGEHITMWPRISIVTVNYNQGAFIEYTIQSVISQNYPNLEYIIIDGGSTDQSLSIIEKYAPFLHYWKSEPDAGMYHAIQKGFDMSTGDILTYINSDDILQPYSLFTVARILMNNKQIHWVSGIPNIIDQFGRIVFVGEMPRWTKYHFLVGQFQYMQQEGTFWTRSLWDRAGGYIDNSVSLAADLELWSRFFRLERIYYMPLLLGSFRRRVSGQKSLEQIEEYDREARAIIKKYLPLDETEKRVTAQYNSLGFKEIGRAHV